MLVIRGKQVHTIVEPTVREFEQDAIDYIKAEFPEELYLRGPQGAQQLVEQAVVKAWGYRLSRCADITALLSLMIVLGEDFDHDPARPEVAEILGSTVLDPDDKLALILEELLESSPPPR